MSRLFLAPCLVLCACASPIALEHALMGYDEKVSQIEGNLLLLNMGRAQAGLPVHFTTVSAITATFVFEVEQDVAVGFDAEGFGGVDARLGTRVAEEPTVSILPMQGEEFARRILTPIEGTTFAFLAHQERGVAGLLRLTSEAFVTLGGEGRDYRFNDPRDPGYDAFRRWVSHLDGLHHGGHLDIGSVTLDSGQERVVLANYDTSRLTPEQRSALAKLAAGYPENFLLVDVAPAHPGGELPLQGLVKLRSFNRVLRFVAQGLSGDFERHVEPDTRSAPVPYNPARTLTIGVDSSDPAYFAASFRGQRLSLPQLDDPQAARWNMNAFRVLHHLLQLTVHNERPHFPPVAIAKGGAH